jgi:hypothetical protein
VRSIFWSGSRSHRIEWRDFGHSVTPDNRSCRIFGHPSLQMAEVAGYLATRHSRWPKWPDIWSPVTPGGRSVRIFGHLSLQMAEVAGYLATCHSRWPKWPDIWSPVTPSGRKYRVQKNDWKKSSLMKTTASEVLLALFTGPALIDRLLVYVNRLRCCRRSSAPRRFCLFISFVCFTFRV